MGGQAPCLGVCLPPMPHLTPPRQKTYGLLIRGYCCISKLEIGLVLLQEEQQAWHAGQVQKLLLSCIKSECSNGLIASIYFGTLTALFSTMNEPSSPHDWDHYGFDSYALPVDIVCLKGKDVSFNKLTCSYCTFSSLGCIWPSEPITQELLCHAALANRIQPIKSANPPVIGIFWHVAWHPNLCLLGSHSPDTHKMEP